MRTKHSAREHLRPDIERLISTYAVDEANKLALADVLERFAKELRAKSHKSVRDERIVRECDRLLPILLRARTITRAKSAVTIVGKRSGLAKWITDHTAGPVTVAEIVDRLRAGRTTPYRQIAYELVSRMDDVGLSPSQVKRIYNRRSKR